MTCVCSEKENPETNLCQSSQEPHAHAVDMLTSVLSSRDVPGTALGTKEAGEPDRQESLPQEASILAAGDTRKEKKVDQARACAIKEEKRP